jgi:hypothetical protein
VPIHYYGVTWDWELRICFYKKKKKKPRRVVIVMAKIELCEEDEKKV